MKKVGNVLYWIIVGVLVIVIASMLYNRYKPNIELERFPQQSAENNGESDKTGGVDSNDEKDTKNNRDSVEEKEAVIAPDFTLEDINGAEISLSDYRGKIVFLNFWGVWCRYCRQEMPDLDSANLELLKGEDAVVVTVDVGDTLEKVKDYIDDENITLPVLMDYKNEVNKIYGVQGYPTTYVIDRDGTVLGRRVGPITEQQIFNLVEDFK